MKEQIREVINLIEKETGYIDNGGLENTLETLLKEQKQETIEGERKRIKSRVGSLRQWLNELPNDFIVSNDVIEHWLEISEELKQEKQ